MEYDPIAIRKEMGIGVELRDFLYIGLGLGIIAKGWECRSLVE